MGEKKEKKKTWKTEEKAMKFHGRELDSKKLIKREHGWDYRGTR